MCIDPDNVPMLTKEGDHLLKARHKVMVLGDIDIIFDIEGIILQVDDDQGLSCFELWNVWKRHLAHRRKHVRIEYLCQYD